MYKRQVYPFVTAPNFVSITPSMGVLFPIRRRGTVSILCLLYTSDAADDRISVDLGGRRIIKKIFFKQKTAYEIRLSLVGSEMCIRDRL